jgi:periplasmic protein TonB
MKSAESETLDDILFEQRNREYGSYQLRKQYFRRLALSLLISLSFTIILVLCYFWFLNTAGDATVYLFPSSGPYLKSTDGSLMDPEDLKAYLSDPAAPQEEQPEKPADQPADMTQNFQVTENASDTFKPPEVTEVPSANQGTELGTSTDSTVFGGFLLGNGEGGGPGNNLDRFPVFPGGVEGVRRYLEMNVKYPAMAIKQKISGVVLISFRVNRFGEVDNIKIERGINPLIDAEAIKAIQAMPRWKPGMRHGRPINVTFVIPVNFIPVS